EEQRKTGIFNHLNNQKMVNLFQDKTKKSMIKKFNNQSEYYPIVLLPEKILASIDYGISEIEIANRLKIRKPVLRKLVKPELPIYSSRQQNTTSKLSKINLPFLLLILIIAIGIGSSADTFLEGFGLGLLIFAVEFFGLWIGGIPLIEFEESLNYTYVEQEEKERKETHKIYKRKLDHYYSELGTYRQDHEKKLNEYRDEIQKNRTKFEFERHYENLKPDIIASRGKPSLKRGIAELRFLEKLDAELRDLVFIDMVPKFDYSLGKKNYNPDFTLICKRTSLHIDIEIDEPYTLKDKFPIHYIDGPDDERNEFFLENNWCIIRLSEKQVMQESNECIATIKSVYQNIINKLDHYTTNLSENERWTYEKSFILQRNKFRESYLN
ncbi:hypothetical protein, partial [Luteirhabdus pelagi]|uniref:hypothetical protein n=1 Tax=Luteirhabdus pelagi TaxID=2792783 RepID=UPI00193A75FA